MRAERFFGNVETLRILAASKTMANFRPLVRSIRIFGVRGTRRRTGGIKRFIASLCGDFSLKITRIARMNKSANVKNVISFQGSLG